MTMVRPFPPKSLLDDYTSPLAFRPAPDVAAWVREAIILDGPLHNPDHEHLEHAEIGVLWTMVPNSRNGRRIVGQAELGEPRGTMGKWAKARAAQQVIEWFGDTPDFIITLDAGYAATCDDASFCALVEHELYHCAQERGIDGAPKFTRDGMPKFAMRGHDIEEFIGVVRRYGADASGVARLIEAARIKPEIDAARLSGACGTCLLKAAA